MLHNEDYFISCDWGTSAFRLKLVETKTGLVRATFENTQGIKKVYDAFLEQTTLEQEAYFMTFLEQQLQTLEQQIGWTESPCRVVVSGMASSSIGLKELPYADLPFSVEGKNLVFEHLYHHAVSPRQVTLISGVKKAGDVMRGEEIQLIGLFQHLPLKYKQGNFIFPGTHTKHIQVKDFEIIDFQTHITGELFEVLKSHSILKNSLAPSSAWNEQTKLAFRAGVVDSQKHPITNALFRIRAKNLQGDLSKSEATYYLSGLLIGSELGTLNQETTVFCCNTVFYPLYKEAIQALDHLEQYDFLPPTQADTLVIQGHKAFLDSLMAISH